MKENRELNLRDIIEEAISDISKDLFDIGIRDADIKLIEDIAREIKVIIDKSSQPY